MFAKNRPMGKNMDYRAFNAKVRMALRDAVKEAHPEPEPGGGEMAYTAPPREVDEEAPQPRRREVGQVHGHGEHPPADGDPRPVYGQAGTPSQPTSRTSSRPRT